ncbi:MAG: hypothetical protein KatS3mg110_3581 [Pirellulaceae bacterium]|nr:MAG: hypothetical protein KatS3mg110_3576 [Pirellulaceae bacterium]GIW95540.1 MAG: hypothetical protein KatS3mg110_3581 [Pirellulaceae bacterium]
MATLDRREHVEMFPGTVVLEPGPGIRVGMMACGALGACDLTTCLVSIAPGAQLPYHTHPTGEAIVVLEGRAWADVENRRYVLEPYDALYVPRGVVHGLRNSQQDTTLWLGTAFPTGEVTREFVAAPAQLLAKDFPGPTDPEALVRWPEARAYSLAERMRSWDLFGRRWGAEDVCGGIGEFAPGAALPCHVHPFDESITILRGVATCWVSGRRYVLRERSTILIPQQLPHRFANEGSDTMVMLWVYAGGEPMRTIVDESRCSG